MNKIYKLLIESPEIVWKPVVGYEGIYEVSNTGQVRSLPRLVKHNYGGEAIKNGVLRKITTGVYGYNSLKLGKGKEQKVFRIHRLVAEAYIPNPNKKPYVNHKNGIKNDNRVENLEWCTPSENNCHAIRTGLLKVTQNMRASSRRNGLKNGIATLMFTRSGAFVRRFNSATEAYRETGCHALRVLTKADKHSKGFVFFYAKNLLPSIL